MKTHSALKKFIQELTLNDFHSTAALMLVADSEVVKNSAVGVKRICTVERILPILDNQKIHKNPQNPRNGRILFTVHPFPLLPSLFSGDETLDFLIPLVKVQDFPETLSFFTETSRHDPKLKK